MSLCCIYMYIATCRYVCMYVCSCVSSIMLLNNAVKAGGKRVVTKHKHEEADPDAYDQKYVDALPEPL